jgi:superoxide reductase
MTQVNEVYLCKICGNKVKVLESGAGMLVCCGEPMKKTK